MSNPSFRIAARLGTSTCLLMFGLIVIGSVVRTTGSGLACPDWPLCHGRLIPPMQFNVLIEWFHRLVALLVGLLLLATAAWTFLHRETRARLGGLAALAIAFYFTQALLGALTVWKLLDPNVVSAHLGVALLLFATLLVFSLVARAEAEPGAMVDASQPRPAALLPALVLATAMIFAQALLGGMVATNHAGLACPDWPTCNGAWFPPMEGLVALQMMHRFGAYAVIAMMLVVAAATRGAPDGGIRAGGTMAFGLTLAQVALGVFNVFLGTPAWLSAAHLATAAALLALLVTLAFRAALLPARRPAVLETVTS